MNGRQQGSRKKKYIFLMAVPPLRPYRSILMAVGTLKKKGLKKNICYLMASPLTPPHLLMVLLLTLTRLGLLPNERGWGLYLTLY